MGLKSNQITNGEVFKEA